jgi:hypothetical protein
MVFRIETPACVEFKKNSNFIDGIFFLEKRMLNWRDLI